MESSQPLVTIISLVYNNAEAAIPGLEAIKNQIYSPVEHIIFDDCSTDDSADRIQKWIDDNNYECRFVKHETNWGICRTLNHGIELAQGKYLYGVTDDEMMPDKLIDDVALLEANPDFAFVYSKMIHKYVKTNQLVYSNTNTYSSNLFHDFISGKLSISTPTTTYRLSVLKEVGGFDEKLLVEDFDMFLKLLDKYKAGFIDKYTLVYNIHDKSIQSTREIEVLNTFLEVLDRWRHLPKYSYYKSNRHLYTFCQLAVKNKYEARKHLLPSLKMWWQPRLWKNLLKFYFVKPN